MDKSEKSSQSIHEFLEKTKNMKSIEAGTKLLGLTEDEIKNILEQKQEEEITKKSTKKTPKAAEENLSSLLSDAVKKLEQERKNGAIAALERLGMKTDGNVKKINAIQFLDDKILIGNTPWAYDSMTGGQGIFKQETNRHYYNLLERKAEAQKQGIVLPEKKDFEDTLKALPGRYSEENWYQGGNILSIILGESGTGYCTSDGDLYGIGDYVYLGSVSECNEDHARFFECIDGRGELHGENEYDRFVCRPLVKNS